MGLAGNHLTLRSANNVTIEKFYDFSKGDSFNSEAMRSEENIGTRSLRGSCGLILERACGGIIVLSLRTMSSTSKMIFEEI